MSAILDVPDVYRGKRVPVKAQLDHLAHYFLQYVLMTATAACLAVGVVLRLQAPDGEMCVVAFYAMFACIVLVAVCLRVERYQRLHRHELAVKP